uniref:Uncharacterized protein n=1 Tax=Gossypium raimondii TaxID=29730 RepID=A0A0D2UUB1_GOSRA|nr:hypothetical protein B456_009G260500 [Gossypium raimondii]
MYKCIFNQPKILSLHFFDALITKGYYLIHLWSFLTPRIWCPWGFLFDCIERRNELGFPYWAGSFQGMQIIYDEKDELQENDLAFLQSGTMHYQTRDRSSKEQGFFRISQFIWDLADPLFFPYKDQPFVSVFSH